MTDLFSNAVTPEPTASETQHLFVDEAGTPTLFHESGKPIADTYGCSRFFILGKLEVEDPPALAAALTELRQKMLADPLFAGTESFKPGERRPPSPSTPRTTCPKSASAFSTCFAASPASCAFTRSSTTSSHSPKSKPPGEQRNPATASTRTRSMIPSCVRCSARSTAWPTATKSPSPAAATAPVTKL